MDSQVLAATITASGTIIAAVVFALVIWYGVAHEIRFRQRADHRRELFIAALRDCTEFLREIMKIAHDLGVVAYDVAQSKQERGLSLVKRVDDVMAGFGVAGTLAPPELADLRTAIQSQVRSLRMVVIGPEGAREDVVRRANEVIRELNGLTQGFTAAFERWKANHWQDVGTRQ
jgi:hypothetical protein